MSRKDEDRVLHGLHYFRESIDEEFAVTSHQILWLAAHSYAEAGEWCADGELQSFDCSVVPLELRRKLLTSKFELPLRYLHFRRLIKLTQTGEDTARISVTFAGADRAMRLHTRVGRLEVWYREHRDGFLGLAMTVAISFITALVAVAVSERLHRDPTPPVPQVPYEGESKARP